jgi:hypothetical protein
MSTSYPPALELELLKNGLAAASYQAGSRVMGVDLQIEQERPALFLV